MEKLFFATVFCLIAMPAFCQEDLQMFETDTAVQLSEEQEKRPNIGPDAQKVESVSFAPVFPDVNVSMGSGKPTPLPFSNKPEKRIKPTQAPNAAISENLSVPVDFSASAGKEIQIVVSKQKQPTEGKKETTQKAQQQPSPKKEPKAERPQQVYLNKAQLPKNAGIQIPPPPKVELFNIADIYLGMQPEDVIETAAESGFELTNVAYGIPSYMITDYERICRQSGLYQTRLIHECIRETAKDNDVYYVSQLTFDRLDAQGKISVLFSSALTDNKAFKIDYTAFGDNSLGTSYKDLLKKTHRRDIFWKYVYDKYGKPQGQTVYFWGSPKKVYLRALLSGNAMDGRIVLEDVEQTGIDYTQATAVDKEKDINNPFHF